MKMLVYVGRYLLNERSEEKGEYIITKQNKQLHKRRLTFLRL
jgi:hypothetical protein